MLEVKEVERKNKNKPSTIRGTDRRGKNRKKRRKQCNVLEEKKKKKKKKTRNKNKPATEKRKERKKTRNVSRLLIHVTSISLCYLNWV